MPARQMDLIVRIFAPRSPRVGRGLRVGEAFQGVKPGQDRTEREGGHDHHGGDEGQSVQGAQRIGPSIESGHEETSSAFGGKVSSITALAMHRISRRTISVGLNDACLRVALTRS